MAEIRMRSLFQERFRIITLFFCIVALLTGLADAAIQDLNVLRSILTVKAPLVRDNKMIYTFNFLFKNCPANNWWYYDSLNKQMIIEFYDTYVNVAEHLSIKGQMPVGEVEIRNVATSIVPSGKKSQIVLHVKKQMHAHVACSGDTLRVILWKKIEQREHTKQRKRIASVYLVPVLIVLVGGFLAFNLVPFSPGE